MGKKYLIKWQGLIGIVVLSFVMQLLQGCCLIFECACNYQHRVRNCSGETLKCRIVSAGSSRTVQLAPGETLRFKNVSELFTLQGEAYDAAFPLSDELFCPLEITPEKTLFVTDPSFYNRVPSPYIHPVYISHDKRFYWWDLVDETLENIQSFQRQLKMWRDPTSGIEWRYRLVEGRAVLESYAPFVLDWAYEQKVILPDFVGEVPVYAIGASFFRETSVGAVTIPNGIEEIGKSAFSACFTLEEVEFPEGLIRIEDQAFVSCLRLRTLQLPDTLESIGTSAFEWCFALTEIRLPKRLSFLGWKAFYYCGGNYGRLRTICFDGPPPAGEGNIVMPSDKIIGVYPDEYEAVWETAMVDGCWRGLHMVKRSQYVCESTELP